MLDATAAAAAAKMIALFAKHNPAEARKIFESAIAEAVKAGDTARADSIRLQCEWHCNPEFRAAMTAEVARLNGL